jgi:hypothetical protein
MCLPLFSPWRTIGWKWSTVVDRHLGGMEVGRSSLRTEQGQGLFVDTRGTRYHASTPRVHQESRALLRPEAAYMGEVGHTPH